MADIERFRSFRSVWAYYKRNRKVLNGKIFEGLGEHGLHPVFSSLLLERHISVMLHDGYTWMTGRHDGRGRVTERFRPAERTFRRAGPVLGCLMNYTDILETLMAAI